MEELKTLLRAIGYLIVLAILILLVFILITLNENLRKVQLADTAQEDNTSTSSNIDEANAWKLIWSDEFEYEGSPSDDHWDFVVGDGCPKLCGFGNNELQHYTAKLKNARVENDILVIEAHNEKIEKRNYSSAKLVSTGKHSMLNGKIEVRCRNPIGVGTWPAVWMMPVENTYGNWPKSGEIDIMEHVGYNPDSIYGTIHCEAFNHLKGTQKAGEIAVPDNAANYHSYILEWNQDRMHWYVDSTLYHTFENQNATFAEWPFDKEYYLILNLAIGGNWGGVRGVDNAAFPAKFEIDYVRYFQKS